MSEQGHGHDYQKIIKTLKPKYSFVYEIHFMVFYNSFVHELHKRTFNLI